MIYGEQVSIDTYPWAAEWTDIRRSACYPRTQGDDKETMAR